MKAPCANYSLYQRFFNSCLREWYFQKEGGSGFYYANPPGILFTQLRTSRLQKGTFTAPMSHWYFDGRVERRKIVQSTPLKCNVFGTPNNLASEQPIESFLHLGYDIWYTKILGMIIPKYTDTYHVAFCNHYDVAFNTLYNVGRSLDMSAEDFQTFKNFRLLTGNVFNLHTLLTESWFKCVILFVNLKNLKCIIHPSTLASIANIVTDDGCVILLTRERDAMNQIKQTFTTPRVSNLFAKLEIQNVSLAQSTNEGSAGCPGDTWDPVYMDPDIKVYIRTMLDCEVNGGHTNTVSAPLLMAIYRKRVSLMPNQRLKKPVDTK